MNLVQSKNIIRLYIIICASLLFIAVFYMPIKYYTLLRVLIFVGALLVVLRLESSHLYLKVAFVLIAILFNPILPIYLYQKIYWIPLDIISGILFLLVTFLKPKENSIEKTIKQEKKYSRDKIY